MRILFFDFPLIVAVFLSFVSKPKVVDLLGEDRRSLPVPVTNKEIGRCLSVSAITPIVSVNHLFLWEFFW